MCFIVNRRSRRCLQPSLFFFSPPVFDYSLVRYTYRSINPVLSIPTSITACPLLPESLIRGGIYIKSLQDLQWGPYFLFITANWRWADSSKSFSATIDQQRAICLSFLIGDINVALCLLKSAVTEDIKTGRGPGVRPEVRKERRRQTRTHTLWILSVSESIDLACLSRNQQLVLTSHTQ